MLFSPPREAAMPEGRHSRGEGPKEVEAAPQKTTSINGLRARLRRGATCREYFGKRFFGSRSVEAARRARLSNSAIGELSRSKKSERLAADAGLETARHAPVCEVDHMNGPVALAGDEQRLLMKSAIHRLLADCHRGLPTGA